MWPLWIDVSTRAFLGMQRMWLKLTIDTLEFYLPVRPSRPLAVRCFGCTSPMEWTKSAATEHGYYRCHRCGLLRFDRRLRGRYSQHLGSADNSAPGKRQNATEDVVNR